MLKRKERRKKKERGHGGRMVEREERIMREEWMKNRGWNKESTRHKKVKKTSKEGM